MSSINFENHLPRPVDHFPPTLWAHYCFHSLTIHNQVAEAYAKEIEILKEQTRATLLQTITSGSCSSDVAEKIRFINLLERLGISYHFEKEIDDQLQYIYAAHHLRLNDLETVALQFRLMRQHGYNISTDIFSNFVDDDGKFKDTSDVKGLLSLYEAAYARTRSDDILEGVVAFAATRLRFAAPLLEPNSTLKKMVTHALDQPLHTGMPRIETRFFISVYQEEEDSSRNDDLLRFAKLDFNLLQMLHKQELSEVSRWWKDLDFVTKLPYARDRAVECYFWALGVYFEPQYSKARVMLAKSILMVSVVDDTYDSYGTIEELEVYTDVIQSWDISEINRLPNYMKISYKAMLDLFDEYKKDLSKEGRSYAVPYGIERMKELVRGYLIEAKWFLDGDKPKPAFGEYLRNAFVTSTYYVLVLTSCYGLKCADEKVFDWLMQNPKLLDACITICRLIDDIATFETEKDRGQLSTGVEYYMNEYGLSLEKTGEKFHQLVQLALQDLNEGLLKPTLVPTEILLRIVNFANMLFVAYQYNQDGYTYPEKVLKPHIIGLLVDPILI